MENIQAGADVQPLTPVVGATIVVHSARDARRMKRLLQGAEEFPTAVEARSRQRELRKQGRSVRYTELDLNGDGQVRYLVKDAGPLRLVPGGRRRRSVAAALPAPAAPTE